MGSWRDLIKLQKEGICMTCLNSISMLRENLLEATKVTISIVNYLKNFMVLSNASCFNSTMLKFNEMKVICYKVKIVMVLFYALEMSILKRTSTMG